MAIIFTDEVQKRCPFRGSIPRPLHMRMRNKGERRQGAASLTHLGVGYGDAEIKVHGRHDAALELELAKLLQWGSVRQGSFWDLAHVQQDPDPKIHGVSHPAFQFSRGTNRSRAVGLDIVVVFQPTLTAPTSWRPMTSSSIAPAISSRSLLN